MVFIQKESESEAFIQKRNQKWFCGLNVTFQCSCQVISKLLLIRRKFDFPQNSLGDCLGGETSLQETDMCVCVCVSKTLGLGCLWEFLLLPLFLVNKALFHIDPGDYREQVYVEVDLKFSVMLHLLNDLYFGLYSFFKSLYLDPG